jgi:hypothetical protein
MAEKTYIRGIFIKSVNTQYGEMLKVDVKWEDFIEQNKDLVNDKGYLKMDICKMLEEKKGNTHYASLNTWRPKESNGFDVPNDKNKSPIEDAEVITESDDLPF